MFLVYFFILDYRKINLTNCFVKLKTCVDTYALLVRITQPNAQKTWQSL